MDLNGIHRRFYGFRNGIVAKALHNAGAPHPRIFGLQLPQIAEIAREIEECEREALARALWKETDCRESRLLACYLFDPGILPLEEAEAMGTDVRSREEADVIAWRLLRRLPYVRDLLPRLSGYVAEALDRNLKDS